jgi:hypothetical protein
MVYSSIVIEDAKNGSGVLLPIMESDVSKKPRNLSKSVGVETSSSQFTLTEVIK